MPEHPGGDGGQQDDGPGDVGVTQPDDSPRDEVRPGEEERRHRDEQERAGVRWQAAAGETLDGLEVDEAPWQAPPEVVGRRGEDEGGRGPA
ncbi:hypothetical protein ACFQH8_08560 [Halomicroarcula sp. GCM10025710]